jgi:glycosyltransferase involved in cell wall biosynthesis
MSDTLSLVICTRNRAERLSDCLRAVGEIRSTRQWEVVVVDNASTDETSAVLDDAASVLPAPLVVVSEPTPGVAGARNRGWRAASGGIVAFTDDDCYPARDFVDRIAARFEEDPQLSFVAGAVELHDLRAARLGIATSREALELRPGMFVTPGIVLSANLAFRRCVLEAIGGFDAYFRHGGGPGGGDVDVVARALADGRRGAYDPDVIVRHDHGRAPGPEADAVRRAYDLGRGAFYAKCALDPRLRRTYLAGWAVLTWGRIRRRESLAPVLREFRGAGSYLAGRRRLPMDVVGVRSGSGGSSHRG